MITDLLGTPSLEDVYHVTSSATAKSLVSQSKPSGMSKLYQLSTDMSHSAVHLLSQMLVFNPVSEQIIAGKWLNLGLSFVVGKYFL